MAKKNKLPIKWMLGVLIILGAAAYWTTQQMSNNGQGTSAAASNAASHNIFFEFLGNMLGTQYKSILSSEASGANNGLNQNSTISGQPGAGNKSVPQGPDTAGNSSETPTRGHFPFGESEALLSPSTGPSETASNVNASQGTTSTAEQGNDSTQKENNPGSNPSGDNSGGSSSVSGSGSSSGSGPGSNPGGYSAAAGGYVGGCVLGCYPGCIPGCDPACNPSVCNFGNTSRNNSGATADQGTGNLSGSTNQYDLPVINPIPTDIQVSQSIAQQNQNKNALAVLVANHQALAASVQQQAQASKYQSVDPQNIPAPSTDQPPADAVQKLQTHQLTYH